MKRVWQHPLTLLGYNKTHWWDPLSVLSNQTGPAPAVSEHQRHAPDPLSPLWPSLDPLQQLHVFAVLKSPEPDTELQDKTVPCPGQRQRFPPSPGSRWRWPWGPERGPGAERVQLRRAEAARPLLTGSGAAGRGRSRTRPWAARRRRGGWRSGCERRRLWGTWRRCGGCWSRGWTSTPATRSMAGEGRRRGAGSRR